MQQRRDTSASEDELTDAVIAASRVLVAVAARSIASVDVTLPQYRALVVLASHGPLPLGFLADQLDVSPSTATRMCDRLVRKGFVSRKQSETSRREVELSVTSRGRALVDHVMRHRREEVSKIISGIPKTQRAPLVDALHAFAEAGGDVPEQAWSLGWPS